MRHTTVAASAGLAALLLAAPAARAFGPSAADGPPRIVVFPSYTPEGGRVGRVEATVRAMPHLEVSRFTGQPLPVLFNDPASVPGAVDPELVLMPLPRVPPSKTQAVYPRGY